MEQITRIRHLPTEPWVELADGNTLTNWTRNDEIKYNQVNRQSEKLRFYVYAFDFLADNQILGDYHEYGCHRARTFRMALTEARRHSFDHMKFFAFDSFEGMPSVTSQPKIPSFQPGSLCTSEEEFISLIQSHGIYTTNVRTIKGFYKDTLTRELQSKFLIEEAKIALVCIDCDLYESALPVFNFIEPLLQEGSLVYIDDFFGGGKKGNPTKGVARAFAEFIVGSNFCFIQHMQVGWWGRSFVCYPREKGITHQ